MDQQAKTNVHKAQHPLAPMQPAVVVPQFHQQQQSAAGYGAMMPGFKMRKGGLQHTSAEKNRGRGDMSRAQRYANPSLPGRGMTHGAGRCR